MSDLLSEKAEEFVQRVSHDAALTDLQVDQWVVMDVVETHLVRYCKPTLYNTAHARTLSTV